MPARLSTGLRNKMQGIRTDLVANGGFESNTTGWTGTGATLTQDAGSGVGGGASMKIANSGAAAGKAYADITTRVGRLYLLKAAVDVGDAGGIQILVGTTSDDDSISTSPVFTDTTITEKWFAFVASATTTRITFLNGSSTSGQFTLVDNVSCEEILDGFGEIMRDAKINIYTGAQPTSADDAASGTLLCTISKSSGSEGFDWDSAASGAVAKPSGDSWTGVAVATGTAGWFRMYEDGGSPSSSSTTEARIDGTVGTSGQQLNISSTAIVSGATQTVSSATITLPAA